MSKEDNKTVAKRTLGMGLSALLGNALDSNNVSNANKNDIKEAIKEIPIQDILPNKNQPRKIFQKQELEDLAKSIKENGIIQPIVVRPVRNKEGKVIYQIIAGERRFRASKIALLESVPVVIKQISEKEAFKLAIIENIQREDLNPLEEAESYNKLITEFNYLQEDIANAVGKSRSYVANMIRLLKLPENVKTLLAESKITVGHARAIINYENQNLLAERIIKENLNVRQVEEIIQKEHNNKSHADEPQTTKKIIPQEDGQIDEINRLSYEILGSVYAPIIRDAHSKMELSSMENSKYLLYLNYIINMLNKKMGLAINYELDEKIDYKGRIIIEYDNLEGLKVILQTIMDENNI